MKNKKDKTNLMTNVDYLDLIENLTKENMRLKQENKEIIEDFETILRVNKGKNKEVNKMLNWLLVCLKNLKQLREKEKK